MRASHTGYITSLLWFALSLTSPRVYTGGWACSRYRHHLQAQHLWSQLCSPPYVWPWPSHLVFCPCSLFIYVIGYNYFFLCYGPFNIGFKDQLPSTEEVQRLLSPQTPFCHFPPHITFSPAFLPPFLLYLLHSSLPYITNSVTEYEFSGFRTTVFWNFK